MSISAVSLSLSFYAVRPVAPEPRTLVAAPPTAPVPPVEPVARLAPTPTGTDALTQAVGAASGAAAVADRPDLADALKDFARALARALQRADGPGIGHAYGHHRGHGHGDRDDDDRRHPLKAHPGRGHDGHRHYDALTPPADRLQSLAARIGGTASDAEAAASPDAADGEAPAAPATARPANDDADGGLRRDALTQPSRRLLDAFSELQRALGQTPATDPQVQREALAGLLQAIADALRSPVPTAPAATAPAGPAGSLELTRTGQLLQAVA